MALAGAEIGLVRPPPRRPFATLPKRRIFPPPSPRFPQGCPQPVHRKFSCCTAIFLSHRSLWVTLTTSQGFFGTRAGRKGPTGRMRQDGHRIRNVRNCLGSQRNFGCDLRVATGWLGCPGRCGQLEALGQRGGFRWRFRTCRAPKSLGMEACGEASVSLQGTGWTFGKATDHGRRQGVPQGTMRRPRLSTWRLLSFFFLTGQGRPRTKTGSACLRNRTPPSVMHYRV